VNLRETEFSNYLGEHCALIIEIPDKQVLLSDEINWHYVLNNCYFGDAKNQADYEKRVYGLTP